MWSTRCWCPTKPGVGSGLDCPGANQKPPQTATGCGGIFFVSCRSRAIWCHPVFSIVSGWHLPRYYKNSSCLFPFLWGCSHMTRARFTRKGRVLWCWTCSGASSACRASRSAGHHDKHQQCCRAEAHGGKLNARRWNLSSARLKRLYARSTASRKTGYCRCC